MLAIDRPSNDDREVPAAPDATLDRPGRSGGIPDQDHGAVLVDAGLRRELALAYRAKVETAYGRAEPGATRGSADQPETRQNIAEKYPDEYRISAHKPSRIDGPHQSPEKWIEDINYDENRRGRGVNCGECARAVQSAWQGRATVAAAVIRPWSGGELLSRMTEWAGEETKPVSMIDVKHRLEELGAGSSAIIGCDWAPPRHGGHWFNAINDSGTIKAVDGQIGKVEGWPPSIRGLEFDENQMKSADAIFFTPDGKVVRNDHS